MQSFRSIQSSLIVAEIIGAGILLQCVSHSIWSTGLAALLLMVGAEAGRRGRMWGVGLSFMSGVSFLAAWVLGMAPPMFIPIGLAGVTPFAITVALMKRDVARDALALFAGIAALFGVGAALVWKQIAFQLFRMWPSLAPTPVHNRVAALGMFGAAALFVLALRKAQDRSRDATRVRVQAGVPRRRVASENSDFEGGSEFAVQNVEKSQRTRSSREP